MTTLLSLIKLSTIKEIVKMPQNFAGKTETVEVPIATKKEQHFWHNLKSVTFH
jgi:hypothetical protein